MFHPTPDSASWIFPTAVAPAVEERRESGGLIIRRDRQTGRVTRIRQDRCQYRRVIHCQAMNGCW